MFLFDVFWLRTTTQELIRWLSLFFIGRVLVVNSNTGIDQVVVFVLFRTILAVHNSTGTDQVVVFVLYRTCSGCAQQHRN